MKGRMEMPSPVTTVELDISLETDVRAQLEIEGVLTEKARARLVAIIQALPIVIPTTTDSARSDTCSR